MLKLIRGKPKVWKDFIGNLPNVYTPTDVPRDDYSVSVPLLAGGSSLSGSRNTADYLHSLLKEFATCPSIWLKALTILVTGRTNPLSTTNWIWFEKLGSRGSNKIFFF